MARCTVKDMETKPQRNRINLPEKLFCNIASKFILTNSNPYINDINCPQVHKLSELVCKEMENLNRPEWRKETELPTENEFNQSAAWVPALVISSKCSRKRKARPSQNRGDWAGYIFQLILRDCYYSTIKDKDHKKQTQRSLSIPNKNTGNQPATFKNIPWSGGAVSRTQN